MDMFNDFHLTIYNQQLSPRTMLNAACYLMLMHALIYCVTTTSPPQFMKDINGYRNACKSIGWEPKQDCGSLRQVIAFHARLGHGHLRNVPVNTTMKYGIVLLNKGEGYNPNTGIFTAPEDGVYSFAWSFLTFHGGTVYIAAVVDNVDKIHTCIKNQQSGHINTSGHLLYELKKGNKVWIRTWHVPATSILGGYYTYFSGSKLNSN